MRHDGVQEFAVGGRHVLSDVLDGEDLGGEHGLLTACIADGLPMAWPRQGGLLRSASLVGAPLKLYKLPQTISGLGVLRHKVRRVGRTRDLSQLEAACTDRLLHPEGVSVKVTKLAESLTGANAYGGGGVAP